MKLFKKIWPFVFIFVAWMSLFFPSFTKGLLPIPADIITGVYYPWLDYKWGFSVGVPVKNPLISDIPSILYPWRSLVVDQLKSFHWPLWNHYYFTGMPLLANFQSAVFSYVNILFIFLPKALAWSVGVMLSPLLTMIFMYLFLRHKSLEKIPSLLGSVVFSLSGFEIAWLQYNVHGHTAMFLPLLLLAIDKIFEGKSRMWPIFLSIFVAFQIFSGYLPIVIYTYIICLFYILFFHFLPGLKEKNIKFKNYFNLILFWILGISLSAIQLVPGYELAKNSIRLIDPTVSSISASYLPIKNFVTFLAPDFFGNPSTGNYFGNAYYDNFYLFIGTGTLIFVIYSLFSLRRNKQSLLLRNKNVSFWFFILLFSFILAIENPLGLFLEKILFLSGGVASKALFITDFSLAILAALGADSFLKNKPSRKIIFPIALIGILLFVSGVYSFKLGKSVHIQIAQRNLLIPLAVYLSCSLILLGSLLKKTGKYVKVLLLLFLGVVTIQLLYSAKKYLPFSKKELLFPTTPIIDFLSNEKNKSTEPFRVELGDVIPQNFLMPYGLETTSGYDALLPKKTGEFLSIVETGKVLDKISRVWLIRNYNSPLFSLLNTKYILIKKQDEKGIFTPSGKPPSFVNDPRYKLVFEDKTVQVYEDNYFLPRAFWVHDFVVAGSSSEFINLVKQDGFNLNTKIVLEKNPSFSISRNESKINTVEWKDYGPDKITLVVESDQPGLVFLSENYFPGWVSFLDGKPNEVYRANYTFRSVVVPEGRHLLSFEYRPKSFLYGKLLTIFSAANLILLFGLVVLKSIWEKRK